MSYGNIGSGNAPCITDAFWRYLSESQKQAKLVSAVYQEVRTNGKERNVEETFELIQATSEMVFAKACDNFQTFVSEILVLIYNKHPHAFFKRKYDAELAFRASDLDDLKRRIIDEQVGDLSYRSLGDLSEFVYKSTGFEIFSSKFQLLRTVQLMNMRNIVTHNRGIVNSFYKTRTRNKSNTLGSKVAIPNVTRIQRYLTVVAKEIDERACQKFAFDNGNLHFRVEEKDD